MQLGCSSSLKLLFLILTGVLVLLSLVYKAFNSSKKKNYNNSSYIYNIKRFFFLKKKIYLIYSHYKVKNNKMKLYEFI